MRPGLRHAGLLALLAGLALPACSPFERPPTKKPINHYLADQRDLSNVRRVMVLPFTLGPGVVGDQERLRTPFVAELAKLRRFEIVPLPIEAQEAAMVRQTLIEGRLSTDAVVRLCRRYNLDGVITGVITDWRAYQPPHLGVRTQLISVHSGSTVWAVDAIYDCNDQSTISDLRHYHKHFQASDGSLHTWEMNMLAPTRFAAYVAHRVIGTWTDA